MMKTKKCSKCKQFKPVNEFYKDKRNKDGLYSYCKDCHNQTVKEYRQTHQDEIKQWRKNRYKQHRQEENQRSIEWRMQHQLSRAQYDANKRGLGFNLLPPPDDFYDDDWFTFELVLHHIDDENVVLIPKPLHNKYAGRHFSTQDHRDKLYPIIKKHYGWEK